jgi:murein DD-endopeptidase MepM/ murein hydrolase activator NlpD
MFQYSDVWGAPVIYVRTDGNPVSASSTYPSSMGEWHYITPFGDEKWELTVSETTSESFVYSSVEGGWHLDFGVRSTYVENGDSVEAAFTEATLDGTTWFDASDSGQWDSFVEMAGGSEWSAIWAVSPSGNRMFHDNDTWDAPVMYTRGPAPDPADPSETPLMDTPYLDASDIGAITEAFSVDENAPWGFEHRGIDFFPASQAPGSLTLIRAVESGTVASVVSWVNPGNGNWQVNVEVAYDPVFTIAYTFEPMSPDATIGEAQLAEIAVQSGDAVQKGDTIGNLYYGEDGTHLDFAILRNQHSVCPEPYFTAEARASVLSILQTTWPGASMCYE